MTLLDRVQELAEAAVDLDVHIKNGPPYNQDVVRRLLDTIRFQQFMLHQAFGFKG